MTVLAGHGQIPVWTVRTPRVLGWRVARKTGQRNDQNQNQFRLNPTAHDLPLAFVLLPQSEKRSRQIDDDRRVQFAVQLEYLARMLSPKLLR